MRFGLIGYGAWGRYHARSMASLGLELAHIACRNEATAAAARQDFPGARVTLDWRDVIADPAVDVVDIVLPNYLHAEVGCAALEAGKDVLLEKPMAISTRGVRPADRGVRGERARAVDRPRVPAVDAMGPGQGGGRRAATSACRCSAT